MSSNARPPLKPEWWTDTGRPPRWPLTIAKLACVLVVALILVNWYVQGLVPAVGQSNPVAGQPKPVAGPKETVLGQVRGPQRPPPRSEPGPFRDGSVASSATEPRVVLSEDVFAADPGVVLADAAFAADPQTVTTVRIATPELPPARMPVADPWPELERRLGSGEGRGSAAVNSAFEEYVRSKPPRNPERRPLDLTVIGTLGPTDEALFNTVRTFLGTTFDAPVLVRRRVGLSELPLGTLRTDGPLGDRSLVTPEVLRLLGDSRGEPPFGRVAVCTVGPLPTPSFTYLRSLQTDGPRGGIVVWRPVGAGATTRDEQHQLLRRTFSASLRGTASVFDLPPCPEDGCGLAGDKEADAVGLCPACLHRLCWNLDVAPTVWLERQERLLEQVGLRGEAAQYRRWRRLLQARVERRQEIGGASPP
ncbi:hypothetical protein [Planctomyces sp. SH-PL14]|uniref:hypothetical protein n=1 Tax=Planctomyces sp. SH-PL14 TaxID=1632864 RepID=UPI00078D3A5A|nr:hypothetical protein [Planctomyces sp. SH-PL14]AMV16993.1 hypothetical protein VT03_03825 [Planctomyces sp. SH-PL14]